MFNHPGLFALLLGVPIKPRFRWMGATSGITRQAPTYLAECLWSLRMFNAERFYRERSARQLCEALRQHLAIFRSNFLPSRLYARGHEPIANIDGTEFDRRESQRLLNLVEGIRREFPDIFEEYSSVLHRAESAWRALQPEN